MTAPQYIDFTVIEVRQSNGWTEVCSECDRTPPAIALVKEPEGVPHFEAMCCAAPPVVVPLPGKREVA